MIETLKTLSQKIDDQLSGKALEEAGQSLKEKSNSLFNKAKGLFDDE